MYSLCRLLCSTLAFDLKGRIVWNEVCHGTCNLHLTVFRVLLTGQGYIIGIDELGQAKVILDDGKLYGGVTSSGQFVMYVRAVSEHGRNSESSCCSPEVPSGTYILSVVTHDYAFERVRSILL